MADGVLGALRTSGKAWDSQGSGPRPLRPLPVHRNILEHPT